MKNAWWLNWEPMFDFGLSWLTITLLTAFGLIIISIVGLGHVTAIYLPAWVSWVVMAAVAAWVWQRGAPLLALLAWGVEYTLIMLAAIAFGGGLILGLIMIVSQWN